MMMMETKIFYSEKRNNTNDLFTNNRIDGGVWNTTTPYFSLNGSFGDNETNADNNDKGGVAFCDFDNDGDFDIVWTNRGVNQIWEQTGLRTGNFTKRGLPKYMLDADDVDGCGCGDVDLDGDMDLFFTDDNNGGDLTHENASYLLLNNFDPTNPAQNFTFSRFLYEDADGGIQVDENGESMSFVDYDNDGDLDIFVVVDGDDNQLWRNNLLTSASADADKKYIKIRVVLQNPTTITTQIFERNLIGSTLILYNDAMTEMVSGIKEINGGRGHGSQDPNVVTFGVPDASASYKLVVKTPAINNSRNIDTISIVPNLANNTPLMRNDQTYTVAYASNDFADFETCNQEVLPITLLYFRPRVENERVWLNWETAIEINNDFFTVERSLDGTGFIPIATVQGAGNSKNSIFYEQEDVEPVQGTAYYRLKQTDFDGKFSYSRIVQVDLSKEFESEFVFFPNPTKGNSIKLKGTLLTASELYLQLYSLDGQRAKLKVLSGEQGTNTWEISLGDLPSGIYVAQLTNRDGKLVDSSKIIIEK